jgi:DNA-binding winged helix-turn-helix (wHTH) protein/TolB-like protein/Flp pilus assembly protein TadD
MTGEITYQFRGFTLDPARRLLTDSSGEPVALTPKVFDLLLFLIQNADRTLTKDQIMAAVWPDTVVEESNLSQNISILRRALGDVRGENSYIATIPGTGYKFVAPVGMHDTPDEADLDTFENEASNDRKEIVPGSRGPLIFAVVGVVLAAIVAGSSYVYFSRRSASGSSPKTLAVLPFKPLVPESADIVLQMGMTDTLISRLSATRGIVLRPLSSVRKFADSDADPQIAGRELGADVVLDGSIQRWGENVRVNARLIKVDTGEALWSDTFDNRYTDIFAVQDAISARVANALRLTLADQAKGGRSHSTTNIDAYRLYLQGRMFQLRATPPDIYRAIGYYQQAIELDPSYARAYASTADAYRMLPITSDVAAAEAFPNCKAAAMKALELDPDLSEAHSALGYVASWYEWDWPRAESEMRRAIELDPNSEDAHRGLSLLLTVVGRHDEAIREMQAARALDPLSLPTNALEAQALFYAGRDDEAVERLNKTFEINPNFWIAHVMLARIYIRQGRLTDALAEADHARAGSQGNSEARSLAGYVYAKLGQTDEALRSIDDLRVAYASSGFTPAYNIALVYNALGRQNDALDWLEKAVEQHDVRLILLKVEGKWDNLRSEPRFETIMRRLNFN